VTATDLARWRRRLALGALIIAATLAAVGLVSSTEAAAGSTARIAAGSKKGATATPGPTAANCKQGLTASTGPTPPDGAHGVGPTPTGVIAFKILYPGVAPFPASFFTDEHAYFNGVDLLAQWCNLEPANGVFNWAPLDQLFAAATAAGKFVFLTLIPGFETPSWALTQPTPVPMVTSGFSYGGPVTPAPELPQPWNRIYLRRWYAFLAKVAGRYGDDPAFRGIEAGGPTSVSTELSLPGWAPIASPPAGQTNPPPQGDTGLPSKLPGSSVALDDSDITMWEAWGYTPEIYVKAWDAVFLHYYTLFPHQYVGVALYPGLQIGDNGTSDPSQWLATPLAVTAAGEDAAKGRYKKRMLLQEDGIAGTTTNPSDPMYDIVKAGCAQVTTGYQDAITMPATNLPSALANVASANVHFWEVLESDVTSTYASTFERANKEFRAGSDCAPLSLHGGSDGLSDGGYTLTAATDVTLSPGLQINIYDGGNAIGDGQCQRTATGETCTVGVQPGGYTADIGVAGTLPYSAQAFASASTVIKPVKPTCKKPGTCS
jgi:hypothetical protein